MFGYATDETEEFMPLTVVLAHKLNAKMAELRRHGTVPWLRPDSKTQVGSKHTAAEERDDPQTLLTMRSVDHLDHLDTAVKFLASSSN